MPAPGPITRVPRVSPCARFPPSRLPRPVAGPGVSVHGGKLTACSILSLCRLYWPDRETRASFEVCGEDRPLNDDEFFDFCMKNADLRIERLSNASLEVDCLSCTRQLLGAAIGILNGLCNRSSLTDHFAVARVSSMRRARGAGSSVTDCQILVNQRPLDTIPAGARSVRLCRRRPGRMLESRSHGIRNRTVLKKRSGRPSSRILR